MAKSNTVNKIKVKIYRKRGSRKWIPREREIIPQDEYFF